MTTMNVSTSHGVPVPSGALIPRCNRTALHIPQWPQQLQSDLKSALKVTSASSDITKVPQLVSGQNSIVDFRRTRSDLSPLARTPKHDKETSFTADREIKTASPRKNTEALPLRPVIARSKQIPGRFFPKACLSEEQKVALAAIKPQDLPPTRSGRLYPFHNVDVYNTPLEKSSFTDSISKSGRDNTVAYNPKIAQTRKSLRAFPEIQTEVFAICFQGDDGALYDPRSELHSDYYSVRRVVVPSTRGRYGQTFSSGRFSIILRGRQKQLHSRLFLFEEEPSQSKDAFHPQNETLSKGDKKDCAP